MDLNGHLRLLFYGPTMINVESEPVMPADYDELPRLAGYMEKVMRRCGGAGLSAPQIGVFKQFFIYERLDHSIGCLVNPQVTQMFGKEIDQLEGCLSIPPLGNVCLVPRMESVMVYAATADEPDVRKHLKFTKAEARVVQHELDHLTGTFFVDRVSASRKKEVLEKFRNWKATWEATGKPFPY